MLIGRVLALRSHVNFCRSPFPPSKPDSEYQLLAKEAIEQSAFGMTEEVLTHAVEKIMREFSIVFDVRCVRKAPNVCASIRTPVHVIWLCVT